MAERIKLGINYQVGDNWIGGKYYLMNLVKSFKKLDGEDQPLVYLIAPSKKSFKEFADETGYEHLTFFKAAKILRWRENIFSFLYERTGMNLSEMVFDAVYPNPSLQICRKSKKNLFWIPDFQELHYPQFFSEDDLRKRKEFVRNIVDHQQSLVLSSESAKKDFLSLYPDSNIKLFVLPFSVSNPDIQFMPIDEIQKKYGINKKYFALPNQLWVHKNHSVVFKAIRNIQKKYPDIQLVCTGKEHDHRDPDHPLKMKRFITDNHLEKNILMLGFIDRMDQLAILNHSVALIQPSLFEGWNTSIEDAKNLNKFVIASDIDVHREQLTDKNAWFFQADNEVMLSELLERARNCQPQPEGCAYEENIKAFAMQFIKIIKEKV